MADRPPSATRAVASTAWLSLAGALLAACASFEDPAPEPAGPTVAGDGDESCPAQADAPELMPGTRPEHTTLKYWLGRYPDAALDEVLLTVDGADSYAASVGLRPGSHRFAQSDLAAPLDRVELEHQVAERLGYLRERLDDGRYVDGDGKPLDDEARARFDGVLEGVKPELRVALDTVPIRCGPHAAGLYKPDLDLRYDRNACSSARAQEVIQLLAPWGDTLWLARTRYALGFIATDAPLSPEVPEAARERLVHGPRLHATTDVTLDAAGVSHTLAKHTTVPRAGRAGMVTLATRDGFVDVRATDGLADSRRPLTRRQLLTAAFGFLDSPYGFGGKDGGRDCSRLQLDLFESFGLPLPRHSGWQARAGTFQVDLAQKGEADRLRLIGLAARRGAVLLHLPGHVMLYLGENDEGRPMALHALGEYAEPCESGKGETVVGVQRTVVSDLEVGRGSSRTSFLERLTGIVVLGAGPGPELASVATTPPGVPAMPSPDACRDSLDMRIFTSPARPWRGQALRAIATTTEDSGEAELWLWDPDGESVGGIRRHLGGPPHTVWTRVDEPAHGTWTAALARGAEVLACKRIRVRPNPPDGVPPDELGQPVWQPRWSWERDTHNLWAAFVEQLFDYPADDGRTWRSLHALLRDPDRNLLFDHLGADEEDVVELVPDCADLPYTLRAYFSWKLSLPYAYRQCSRGRVGRPPSCGPPRSNLMPREQRDHVRAFAQYANRNVRSGVHSASGRTHPEDDATDLYPVALERASLPPGTVYADPYGHVMMLTRWFRQGETGPYGVLMAAEAQPDGTVGRRRFWRGSFLFDPSTEDVGAGFKHFRPLVYDAVAGRLLPLTNEELANHSQHAHHSLQQYAGGRDDFYDRMDVLINPEPLDPDQRMRSLVDALDESTRRRVIAVDNGETFMKERGFQPIEMPRGHDIFETEGPWEDFSTPSRDMRLLISLDTVLSLPAQVKKYPERFHTAAGDAARVAAELEKALRAELERRRFVYRASDGSERPLTLADLVDRAEAMELAYNPNDCIEVRWGAAEGSEEMASCRRRAPNAQRELMRSYRPWFRDRTRPARGTVAPPR